MASGCHRWKISGIRVICVTPDLETGKISYILNLVHKNYYFVDYLSFIEIDDWLHRIGDFNVVDLRQ